MRFEMEAAVKRLVDFANGRERMSHSAITAQRRQDVAAVIRERARLRHLLVSNGIDPESSSSEVRDA